MTNIIMIVSFLIYSVLVISVYFEQVINKHEIWDILLKAIKKNASIDILNNLVKNHKRTKRNRLFSRNTSDFYKTQIILSEVLQDLKANEYISAKEVDVDLLQKIDKLIDEDAKESPFDGLEEKQKDIFLNISNILDKDTFEKIQVNLNKISNELIVKTEEANKQKKNFKIAIISIVLTLFIGFYQVYDSSQTSNKIIKALDFLKDATYAHTKYVNEKLNLAK